MNKCLKILSKKSFREVISFAFNGVLTVLFFGFSYFLLISFDVSEFFAFLSSYTASLVINYCLNNLLTWKNENLFEASVIFRYVLSQISVGLAGAFLNVVLVSVLSEMRGTHYVSLFLTLPFTTIANFVLQKYWVFKSQ